ncbi:JmjC domain-containing protein [Pseudomonas entomophila]|uniref:JmjC domain-containing protein n=1 Tax=Pseudomonas entomophila TaxID=312306 RepID=UPI001EFFE946|nr:cupin domain-containing protein [Pseudomonas entomophila]MCG8296448.1 cupin domain-containing protein [Pseudomonas entomophila]
MKIEFAVGTTEFAERYQEKRPILLKKAVSPYMFSWRDVNAIYERSDVASDDFKLAFDGVRPKEEYVGRYWDIGTLRCRLIKPVVYEYLRKGATLIANKIASEPKVESLARCVSEYTGRQVVSSAYVAFGTRDSFRSHWDTRDVFAIQLIGRKRWVVHEPSFESPLYMQQSKDYEHLHPRPETAYMDVILEPGDVMYLPRGWWHNPSPIGEATFHLALGTFPAYAMDYLGWSMKHMHEHLATRCSLQDWQSDQATICQMTHHLSAFLNNKQTYDQFMDDFVGATRMRSSLAMEVFGDSAVNSVTEDARIRLSSSLHRLNERHVIVNGVRLNLDELGAQLLSHIARCPGISLSELANCHVGWTVEHLRHLVFDMCCQDVLEWVRT